MKLFVLSLSLGMSTMVWASFMTQPETEFTLRSHLPYPIHVSYHIQNPLDGSHHKGQFSLNHHGSRHTLDVTPTDLITVHLTRQNHTSAKARFTRTWSVPNQHHMKITFSPRHGTGHIEARSTLIPNNREPQPGASLFWKGVIGTLIYAIKEIAIALLSQALL